MGDEKTTFEQARWRMVREHIHARGVRDPRVLEAMSKVPREEFVPLKLRDSAYEDAPLPIGQGQTISQPYIVAFMVEALALQPGARVLEVGAGCGYAAAVMAQMSAEVFTIERLEPLAELAANNLHKAGYDRVQVRFADGTQGWEEVGPFDAILVSAGGPSIPESLKRQLKVGGRLVIPVGTDATAQELVRVTRTSAEEFDREDLADVRFVPLIGAEGWETSEGETPAARVIQTQPRISASLPKAIVSESQLFDDLESANLSELMEDVGDARIVLIGEASHGTSEFYRFRARLTQRLIEEKGFTIVAAEADWPDAARIDHYVRHRDASPQQWQAFARFPTWMWRNVETQGFVDWLHARNAKLPYSSRAGFYGLDLYSMYTSVQAVLQYLDDRDPELAAVARVRYGCLSPWEADPAAYGHAAVTGRYRNCEKDVTEVLVDLLKARARWHEEVLSHDIQALEVDAQKAERVMDAVQNAQVVTNAESYYRTMYYGSRASWNLRDSHMFETLKQILAFRGEDAKAIVWAHNSHIGDASATEMSLRGEHNIGQLCAQSFPKVSYRIGFGTDHGTVAAATNWDSPMEVKQVVPAHRQSHEFQFHQTSAPGLILPLRSASESLRQELSKRRLERAIGVIYRPETELASHYFEADLARQFDAYIWLDETSAVTPIATRMLEGLPDTYPFGV
ncbi:MAG: protein-L-isoaspartate(D-aspartate) O-methyltransferase [Pseudomonadales bacterium]|jgi:protein-L-isoaspartate(D-aspartate) O-methyltransferase|nr:protein-L-isoaspartate(D-aspartate) O-methyltransferase [Pseudomonadales bacterium]